MPTSVLAAVALSVLLGSLVMLLHWADSHSPDSKAADDTTTGTESVAGTKHIDSPQVRWNVSRGSGAYRTMLDQLRNLAVTDNTESQGFAGVVISSDNDAPTVHAVVRLSDFRVVRFSSGDTPHDVVLNLASDFPHEDDATDDNRFLGKEGYDALARVANQSLTSVDLSASSLENSLRDLGTRGTDRTAQARGMLRYLIAITEASRFRPIADHIANGMDDGSDVFVTAQQAGLMRD
ncbi:ribosome-inactivating family protein [Streptomyces sp. NPDC019990]|uniref:ribosome-inactivating family protein n=1 Tax=Streptomyces sp. NPDC019990 TaxID=3154693 RepID=UPI0033DCCAAD